MDASKRIEIVITSDEDGPFFIPSTNIERGVELMSLVRNLRAAADALEHLNGYITHPLNADDFKTETIANRMISVNAKRYEMESRLMSRAETICNSDHEVYTIMRLFIASEGARQATIAKHHAVLCQKTKSNVPVATVAGMILPQYREDSYYYNNVGKQ